MKHPIIITRQGKTMTYTQWFINRYGFKIGMAIVNPRGVAQGSKTTIIGI